MKHDEFAQLLIGLYRDWQLAVKSDKDYIYREDDITFHSFMKYVINTHSGMSYDRFRNDNGLF